LLRESILKLQILKNKMRFEPQKGTNFYHAVEDCKIEMINQGRLYMDMIFNDIEITVSKTSFPDDLAMIYDLKCKLVRNGLSY